MRGFLDDNDNQHQRFKMMKFIAIFLLFLYSTASAMSCPTTYYLPNPSQEKEWISTLNHFHDSFSIQALENKEYTKSQLESFVQTLTSIINDPQVDSLSDFGESNYPFIGCYNQNHIGDACTVLYKERVEVLLQIYTCHKNSGWPSATDSHGNIAKGLRSSAGSDVDIKLTDDQIFDKYPNQSYPNYLLVDDLKKINVKTVSDKKYGECLTTTSSNGMLTKTNHCNYDIVLGYCLSTNGNNGSKDMCSPVRTNISPSGVNYVSKIITLSPGQSFTNPINGQMLVDVSCKVGMTPIIITRGKYHPTIFKTACSPFHKESSQRENSGSDANTQISSSSKGKSYPGADNCIHRDTQSNSLADFWVNSCNFPVNVMWFDSSDCNSGCSVGIGANDRASVTKGQQGSSYRWVACPKPSSAKGPDGIHTWANETAHKCTF